MTFAEMNRMAGGVEWFTEEGKKNVHQLFILYQDFMLQQIHIPTVHFIQIFNFIVHFKGCCSDNALNFYVRCTLFESQLEHCLPRLRFFVVS